MTNTQHFPGEALPTDTVVSKIAPGAHEDAERLAARSLEICIQLMESTGNTLSDVHHRGLDILCRRLAEMSMGIATGRIAFDLPCGTGKTTAVIAHLKALTELDLDTSVLVCAGQVKELEDIWERLAGIGTPMDQIGLMHSKASGEFRIPPTDNNGQRKLLLATHQKMEGRRWAQALTYRDGFRQSVIWDESLITSDWAAVEFTEFDGAIAWLSKQIHIREMPVIWEWGQQILRQVEEGAEVVTVPPLDIDAISVTAYYDNLRHVFEVTKAIGRNIRIVELKDGRKVIRTLMTVPEEMANVIVLDASYPIRELQKLDASIGHDEEFSKLEPIKRYDGVTINISRMGAGRSSFETDYRKARSERRYSKMFGQKAAEIPKDEAVLHVMFRDRPNASNRSRRTNRGVVQMRETFQQDLSRLAPRWREPMADGRPQHEYISWGQERATSAYKHCKHVLLHGVLQMADNHLAGGILGQTGDLSKSIGHKDIHDLRTSEAAHCVHQAVNRAQCRDTVDGQAKETVVWMTFPDARMDDLLREAMPGVKIVEWDPGVREKKPTKVDETADSIVSVLQSLTDDSISIRKLKADAEADDVSRETFRAARDVACGRLGWKVEGSSLVRANP